MKSEHAELASLQSSEGWELAERAAFAATNFSMTKASRSAPVTASAVIQSLRNRDFLAKALRIARTSTADDYRKRCPLTFLTDQTRPEPGPISHD